MTQPPTTRRRGVIPAYPVALGIVFAICTVGMALNLIAAIATDVVDTGPRTLSEQLAGVIGFGIGGLTISLLGAWWFSRTEARAKVGAIVFGALAVPTIILFFSGTPGMFGATAAFLAGLTRGRTAATGAPRVFGIVGLVFAILNVLVTVAGVSIAWIVEGSPNAR
ncbi:hypothetical protein [Calidifontibacter indicus]|uniref:hypothetical protein n=1 Tax=Calidifontibacter indicus TaxID=419650 RepID=UPI003D76619C